MTNRKKYNDELMAIWESGAQFAVSKESGAIKSCKDMGVCVDCAFYFVESNNSDCQRQRAEWLKARYIESVKTVKASELPANTIVMCSRAENGKRIAHLFATLFEGKLYAKTSTFGFYNLIYWEYMWLEDGTVVLPE